VSDILEAALSLRERAGKLHRHSDAALYRVLVGCLELCERGPEDLTRLREDYKARPFEGKNRSYIEVGSDEFQTVCRYVFNSAESGANINRYACALRQAAALQIRSGALFEHLRKRGGVNALYLARPLEKKQFTTKALRLNSPITVGAEESFTITLLRRLDNSYDVLAVGRAT